MKALRYAMYWVATRCVWRDDLPKEMLQNGRPPDSAFAGDELLYLRCMKDWVEDKKILPAYVHFPDQSVNRSKYSRPWHVLLPDGAKGSAEWIYWGIPRTTVSAIPGPIETAGGVSCSFGVEHDPLHRNFGHSELSAYKNGIRERNKKKINESVKKLYRQLLSEQTRVILSAEI